MSISSYFLFYPGSDSVDRWRDCVSLCPYRSVDMSTRADSLAVAGIQDNTKNAATVTLTNVRLFWEFRGRVYSLTSTFDLHSLSSIVCRL